jgi:hypothetical protein
VSVKSAFDLSEESESIALEDKLAVMAMRLHRRLEQLRFLFAIVSSEIFANRRNVVEISLAQLGQPSIQAY